MRAVRGFEDVSIILKEVFDWKDRLSTKDWDFRGLRIKNAAPAVDPNDYVTLKQLKNEPVSIRHNPQHFTIVWTKETPTIDDVPEAYCFGPGREGSPVELWVVARGAPTSDDLSINIEYSQSGILNDPLKRVLLLPTLEPLVLLQGQSLRVFTSTFRNPVPKFSRHDVIYPTLLSIGGATSVSIGLVVKVDTPEDHN